jgi:hypothetical protein
VNRRYKGFEEGFVVGNYSKRTNENVLRSLLEFQIYVGGIQYISSSPPDSTVI